MKPTLDMLLKEIRRLDNRIEHRASLVERAQQELDALLVERERLSAEYKKLAAGTDDEDDE